jgi:hypothetical protein
MSASHNLMRVAHEVSYLHHHSLQVENAKQKSREKKREVKMKRTNNHSESWILD